MNDFAAPALKNYFGLPASPTNFVKPQKRAMTSMSPTILTDENGEVRLIVGAAGGTKIITAVALVCILIIIIYRSLDLYFHVFLCSPFYVQYGSINLLKRS